MFGTISARTGGRVLCIWLSARVHRRVKPVRALVLCKRVQFGRSQTCFGRSDRSKFIGEARAQGDQLSPNRI
jgi:hypothetical protein